VRARPPLAWTLSAAILAVLLINEAAVAGHPELNLISRHDTLHSTPVEDHHIGIADVRGRVGNWIAAKEREQITVRFGRSAEDKPGLIQRAVVGGSVIDTADKVDRRIEWKLAQCCNPRVCQRWIYILCSVNGFDPRISSCPDLFCQNPETSRGISINVLRLVGREYLTWYNERALGFMADGSHDLLWELEGFVYQQLAGDGHVLCRQVSDIFDRQLDPEEDASLIIRGEALRFNVGQHYPRPFSRYRLVELTLHRFGLVSHNTELFAHRHEVFSSFLISAAQREPLQGSGTNTEKTDYYQQPSRANQPARYRYQWGFVGVLAICLGAALLRASMELFYEADKASRFSPAAWITFLIGGAIVAHGLIYACTGIDGFRDLYLF